MALEEAGRSGQIQIFWFWCDQHWNAGSESPCSGLVRCPLCYHNPHTTDNNPHARGCVRTPRSPPSPYCSLCLPARVWGTTSQEQQCHFSPAELLGAGRKFQQHKHSELSRRGSAQHAHTDIRGCCAVSSLPSTGALWMSCPNETATLSGTPPRTAHPQIPLLLDLRLCEIFPGDGCIEEV